jgi:hypothetical protein
VAHSSSSTASSFGRATAHLWRALTGDLFNTYHPERHYMRGPGPKWRAKHALATAPLSSLPPAYHLVAGCPPHGWR